MEHGKPGVTGGTAPSPVVEELKKDTESASQFQPIARENHMSPGSVTSTNVRYVCYMYFMTGLVIQIIYLAQTLNHKILNY